MARHLGLGALSAGAAVIHFVEMPGHFREDVLFGLFFLAVAAFQFLCAAAFVLRPSRRLYVGAIVGNGLVLGVWAVSRTVGLPLGPNPGVPEPVALIDAVAAAYEAGIVAACLYVLSRPGDNRHRAVASPTLGVSGFAAIGLTTLVAVLTRGARDRGTALSEHAHSGLVAHHLFHVVFIGGASVIFCLYIAVVVAHNGWPVFSWHLDANRGD